MLVFKPKKISENICFYEAFEDDLKLGFCEINISNQYAEIMQVKALNDDSSIAEGLIRSALNFAANEGAYIAKADSDNVDSQILIKMGFKNKDGIYQNDIPSALQGTCKSFA